MHPSIVDKAGRLATTICWSAALLLCLPGGTRVARAASGVPVPAPPRFAARAWLIEDAASGRVLAAAGAQRPVAPGSLAKLMTLYLTFRELAAGVLRPGDRVPIDRKVWEMHGAQMFLLVGTRVPVSDLVRGMIVDGANDAAVAIAQYIAGSQAAFVRMMNRQARQLGMRHTHFSNASGLPAPGMHTTAADMGRLARALIRRFPQYYHFFRQRRFRFNGITQYNRNVLLWRDRRVDGLETGNTRRGGFNLVASAHRDGERMIVVVLGTVRSRDRFAVADSLLRYAFHYYRTRRLYRPGVAIALKRVWGGAAPRVAIGVARPVWVTYPRGAYDSLQVTLTLPRHLIAPLGKGKRLGMLRVSRDNRPLARAAAVTQAAVAEGGLWERWYDAGYLAVTRRLRAWFPALTRAIASN